MLVPRKLKSVFFSDTLSSDECRKFHFSSLVNLSFYQPWAHAFVCYRYAYLKISRASNRNFSIISVVNSALGSGMCCDFLTIPGNRTKTGQEHQGKRRSMPLEASIAFISGWMIANNGNRKLWRGWLVLKFSDARSASNSWPIRPLIASSLPHKIEKTTNKKKHRRSLAWSLARSLAWSLAWISKRDNCSCL